MAFPWTASRSKPAKVDWQNPEQLRFVLTEGKKRQIRRMCELVGLKVVGLKRIRIGRVTLGNLPVGQWRYLGRTGVFDAGRHQSSDLYRLEQPWPLLPNPCRTRPPAPPWPHCGNCASPTCAVWRAWPPRPPRGDAHHRRRAPVGAGTMGLPGGKEVGRTRGLTGLVYQGIRGSRGWWMSACRPPCCGWNPFWNAVPTLHRRRNAKPCCPP